MHVRPAVVLLAALVCVRCTPGDDGVSSHPVVDAASPRFEIGAFDGAEHENFAWIAEVAAAPAGGVLVLDKRAVALAWFDSAGRLVDRVDGVGRGPGELAFPTGLFVDSSDVVHVIDARNARISSFALEDRGLTHLDDRRINLMGNDLCRVGDAFVVNAYGLTGSLHLLTDSGSIGMSFGENLLELGEDALNSSWFRRTWQQNRGYLLCGHPAVPVVFAHFELPYVRGFNRYGREIWRTRLTDFHPVRWEAHDGGRSMREAPDPETGTVTYAGGVTTDGAGNILVGTYEYWYDKPRTYHTYVLDARTGRQLARLEVPMVLTAYRDGTAFGYREETWPRVVAYSTSEDAPSHP